MPSNVEVKARVSDLGAVHERAVALTRHRGEIIEQTDTFFAVPRGRLKVRRFADGTGELIAYERPDEPGPKASQYARCACGDARALEETLRRALPALGTVSKRRELFLVGRTRVHLDSVAGLGSFVELEVVLRDGESVESAEREAADLLARLGIPPSDLVAGAYLDLLSRDPSR